MKDEYFSAGDMAYRDEDGYYVLVDRKANMIISGGENIFPSEVENCRWQQSESKRRSSYRCTSRKMGRTGNGSY